MNRLAIPLSLLLMGGIAASTSAAQVGDNFNDNSLDPSKWSVLDNTPGPGSVNEQNMRAEIVNRAHLVSTAQFDPTVAPVTINGQWTFANPPGGDFIQVLTRTDGLPAGSFGETNSGLEFSYFANGGANNLVVTNRGSGGFGVSGVVNTGTLTANAGDVFDFSIVDSGSSVSYTMTEVGNPSNTANVTANVTGSSTINRIAFHNRENSGRTAHLDDVSITSSAAPFRLTDVIGTSRDGFTVRDVQSTGTINSLATADALLAGAGIASETTATGVKVINFLDTGGNGNFGADSLFPNNPTAGDDNNFAISATTLLHVNDAGNYTFGHNTDDGGRLRIDGADVFVNDVLSGEHNFFGSIFLDAGTYELEYVYFEATGGAEAELFVAQGIHTSFNGNFELLTASTPEPASIATWTLIGLTLSGFGYYRTRRKNKA